MGLCAHRRWAQLTLARFSGRPRASGSKGARPPSLPGFPVEEPGGVWAVPASVPAASSLSLLGPDHETAETWGGKGTRAVRVTVTGCGLSSQPPLSLCDLGLHLSGAQFLTRMMHGSIIYHL